MEWRKDFENAKDGRFVILGDDENVAPGRWVESKGRTLVADDPPYWEPFDYSYWEICEGFEYFEPTDWMPLPAPPQST